MKSLAFIGHSHHSITKSSNFFKRLLDDKFVVHEFAIDPADPWEINLERLSGIAFGDFDGIVLWQIDYLASFFLRKGFPVIICPMYDSSSTLKPAHWSTLRESLIICFSLELQWLVAKAGVESIYVKYFPSQLADLAKPSKSTNHPLGDEWVSVKTSSSQLKAFFWERLPDSTLSSQQVIRLLSHLDIDHLHIHQAPDPGRIASTISHDSTEFPITTSTWFESSDEYRDILRSADIFIAPRFSEGIGMSFLEAMARGCCVIAHDMATHNEYINNWNNGILVNFGAKVEPLSAGASDLRAIGRKAENDSFLLRKNWEEFYLPLMLDSIDQYLSRFPKKSTLALSSSSHSRNDEHELRHLFAAHNDWERYYAWLDQLNAPGKPLLAENKKGIVRAAIALEQKGEYGAALAMLDSAIEEYSSTSVYDLFRRQLLDRMNSRNDYI